MAFRQLSQLKQHQASSHPELPTLFPCDRCNKRFAFKRELKQHLAIHEKQELLKAKLAAVKATEGLEREKGEGGGGVIDSEKAKDTVNSEVNEIEKLRMDIKEAICSLDSEEVTDEVNVEIGTQQEVSGINNGSNSVNEISRIGVSESPKKKSSLLKCSLCDKCFKCTQYYLAKNTSSYIE